MDIFRSKEKRNVMMVSRTLHSKERADEIQAIADHIILPYRKKLMSKVARFEGEFVVTVSNDD